MSLRQWIAHLQGKRTALWVLASLIAGTILFGMVMLAMMYVTLD